jgi:hypothetical protein
LGLLTVSQRLFALASLPPLVCLLLLTSMTRVAIAQFAAAQAKEEQTQAPAAVPAAPPPSSGATPATPSLACPGSFPTDFTVLNCRYTTHQRVLQLFTTGITDQAMAQSIFGPIFTQFPSSPLTSFDDYGYRVGTSYTGSVGRATAEFLVGAVLHTDPRHVSCASDPRMFRRLPAGTGKSGEFRCTNLQRFGHFLIDSVTVRISSSDGNQHRIPAIERAVGIYGGAYAQYPLEPRSQNSFVAITQRSLFSFGTTFFGSFYTEYGTSFLKLRRKNVPVVAE